MTDSATTADAVGPSPGAGGVVVRPVAPHEDDLVAACARLVADVYGGEGLVGDDGYLEYIVADAGTRAREALVLAALDLPRATGDGTGGPVVAPEDSPAGADRLLGTTTYARHDSQYANLARPGEAEMRMLAVAAGARGRGVGRLLTSACVERARREGCERFVLSTGPEMQAAHELYRSMGMTRTPERDWSPVPGITLMTFGLDLAPAADPAPAG